jgi:hypothetical protein
MKFKYYKMAKERLKGLSPGSLMPWQKKEKRDSQYTLNEDSVSTDSDLTLTGK